MGFNLTKSRITFRKRTRQQKPKQLTIKTNHNNAEEIVATGNQEKDKTTTTIKEASMGEVVDSSREETVSSITIGEAIVTSETTGKGDPGKTETHQGGRGGRGGFGGFGGGRGGGYNRGSSRDGQEGEFGLGRGGHRQGNFDRNQGGNF
jgi:hypothetical protein